jgi:hypothetical protein
VAKIALGFDFQGNLVLKRQYLYDMARGPELLGDQMTGQEFFESKGPPGGYSACLVFQKASKLFGFGETLSTPLILAGML